MSAFGDSSTVQTWSTPFCAHERGPKLGVTKAVKYVYPPNVRLSPRYTYNQYTEPRVIYIYIQCTCRQLNHRKMENRRSNEKHKCISTNKLIQTFTEIAQQKFQVVSFAAFKRSLCSSRSKRHVLGPNKEREI